MRIAIALVALLFSPALVFAGGTCSGVKGGCGRSTYRSSPPTSGGVYVSGYTRSDGTYVRPHTRHAPRTADDVPVPALPTARYRSTARTTARTSVWTGDVTDSVATMAPVVERQPSRTRIIPEVTSPTKPSRPIPAPVEDPLLRVWTDRTGSYSLTARFGGMLGTTVTLKKLDGTPIKLEFDQLSDADQQWITARRHQ